MMSGSWVPTSAADYGRWSRIRTRFSSAERLKDLLMVENGMAAVYLARDLKHERPIALKV
jgi:hypothetical protein